MSSHDDSISMSKKNKREVTSFLGHELLFDYISGQLDPERKKAVDQFLENSKEAQQDLIKILNGVKYAEQLAETVVSQSVVDKVQEPETYLSVLLQKSRFDRWPLSLKWAIEAMVVVTGIVILLILIPWDRALRLDLTSKNQEIILAEVKRPLKSDRDVAPNQPSDRGDSPEFQDEISTDKVKAATVQPEKQIAKEPVKTPTAVSQIEPVKVKAAEPVVKTDLKKVPEPVKTNVKVTANKAPAATTDSDTEGDESVTQPVAEKITKATSGTLFRGILKVTNAEAVTPKISEKIQQLGGRKAGEVELGWKKTENSYYYHFTIPQAKYADLKAFLAEYTTVDIHQENHPRVMPDGIIRLILQVEEKKP